jgi:predicted patatin/cPLA2 family phospholipase
VLRDPEVEQQATDSSGDLDLKRAFQLEVLNAVGEKARRLQQLRARGLTVDAFAEDHIQLVLSAGGQYGAYGAGFLRAWLDGGRQPTCGHFDFVTGVSTGSMMATHVFVATAEQPGQQCANNADARAIDELYQRLSDKQVFRERSKLEAVFSDSLYDTTPLHRLVDELLTESMLDRVGAERDKGRRLFAGAVNADSGQFEFFDLTYIAKRSQGHQRKACYASAILASSAIPIGFNPVFMNGAMYIDGGARTHTFFMDESGNAMKLVSRANELEAARKKRLYGIINGDLCVRRETVGRGLLPIAVRTANIGTDQLLVDSAFYVSRRGKEEHFDVRWTTAASSGCGAPGGFFDPAFERCLSRAGRTEAGKPDAWLLFDDIERLTRRGAGQPSLCRE